MDMRKSVLLAGLIALQGCTVVQVKPIDPKAHEFNHACIEKNPAVKMSGFLPMIEKRFADHGIATETYLERPPESCEYTVSYVAHWNWDIGYYLTDAEIVARRGGEVVGRGVYHLRNKGGLDLGKYASAESKINPVIDQMLAEFKRSAT
jgi:hypothetical protein